MSRTATVPLAVRSSTLVSVPYIKSFWVTNLARLVCCHHLVSLSLPWRASRASSITWLPRLAVYGAIQALQPVRPWVVGQSRKTQRFQRTFFDHVLLFIFEVLLFSSHVPVALSVPRLVCWSSADAAFCPIALPARPLVKTAP